MIFEIVLLPVTLPTWNLGHYYRMTCTFRLSDKNQNKGSGGKIGSSASALQMSLNRKKIFWFIAFDKFSAISNIKQKKNLLMENNLFSRRQKNNNKHTDQDKFTNLFSNLQRTSLFIILNVTNRIEYILPI